MDIASGRSELLQVADAVAREKSIAREEVLEAMELAIQKAGRAKYGHEKDIRARIDPRTGEVQLARYTEVVEHVENEATQIALEVARKFKPDVKVGDFLVDPLPPIDFGRIAAQTAKQVIVQKVREYERKRQYLEYKDRVGEIVNGIVKRTESGNLLVDLGRAEALLPRKELIPRENFKNGDRVRAYIFEVRDEPRGPQILLSRTHPGFLAKLFAQEVPEIYDGIIEIKAVARDPGSRAKMAVISRDSSIDPVGACVGMHGARVKAVVAELQGERIDIIPWSPQAATFVVNALAPAEVTKVVIDEEAHKVEVVVPDDQLSLAIGRRGQNVHLASALTGWNIDILSESKESERRQEEFRQRTGLFVEALDVDDVIAGLLVTEGFETIEDLAYTPVAELAEIEGFDEEIAAELKRRAEAHLLRREAELEARRRELGVSDELAALEGLTPALLVALGEHGVRTLDDLADLATDELLEITGPGERTAEEAEAWAAELIMKARAHWFAEEGHDGVQPGGHGG
jgi:N utilization substance protein A